MSKNKLYTLSEEISNSITHGIGSLLSIAALVLMIVVSAIHHNAMAIVTSTLFGVSLIMLYTMSTLYHAITNEKAKKFFRIMDHNTIFVLIAGTYTPITLFHESCSKPKFQKKLLIHLGGNRRVGLTA